MRTEVVHGPNKEMKSAQVVMPVLEVPTSDPVRCMVSTGMISTHVVDGIVVQNGQTTLSQVRSTACTH
jgi:hypothetical protein